MSTEKGTETEIKVKTYEETVEHIAMKSFDNVMAVGSGRIDLGHAPFIYSVEEDKMYRDVKEKEREFVEQHFMDF